ncbi:MAG: S-layer homology domain-containing protein [Clostridiales bacterium]|nr:S-layer homology domain-containing protein [Clostridiales bacterium]MCF8022779.1 S-layer homology domain-containing protein [Clostridiales bacterium]
MIKKQTKLLTLLLCLLFALTIGVGAAGASSSTDQDVANKIVEVYSCLNDSGKDAINEARGNVVETETEIENSLDPIFENTSVVERYDGDADKARNDITNMLYDLAKNVQYADPDSSLEVLKDNISSFREDHNDTVTDLLGSDIDAGDLLDFYIAVTDNVKDIVRDNPVDYGTALLNYDESEIKSLFKEAYHKNNYSQEDVKSALEDLGLTVEKLYEVRVNINNKVDPNHDAEEALLGAYLVSQTSIELDTDTDDDGTSSGSSGGGGAPAGSSDPDEAAGEAEETVDNPDATDDEVADSANNAADSLDSAARDAETSEDAEKVVDTVSGFSETLDKAVDRVEDADAAGKLGDSASTVASSLAEAAGKVTSDEGKQKIGESASKVIDTASRAMDKMDGDKASEVAENMIKSAASLGETLGEDAAKDVTDKTVDLAEKAVERAGTDKIPESEVKVEGDKASVEANPDRIQEKAQKALEAAEKMQSALEENGIESGKEVSTSVSVEVPATGKDEVETNLPAGTLETLAENNVDKLNVKTEVASFGLSADTFGEESKGKDVSLSASNINHEDLPGAAKNLVPSDSTVVDLNASVDGNKTSNFEKPVEVSIPYTLNEGEDPDEVTVFVVNDDGAVEPVGGKYDPATGQVKFNRSHFSKYFAKTARKEFSDLGNFEWARNTVEVMAGKGLIAGRTAATFDPAADITRAEFSALAVRMLALEQPAEELPFKDIAEGAWYRNVVAAAYANNIVAGKSADVFDPNGKITRQEIAVIISRIMVDEGYKQGKVSDLAAFKDQQQISRWARNGAALASREGIVKGLPGSKFAPDEKANRAQAAVMLYRLYEKLY